MKQKAFCDITVREIAQKAELDRRTFYRHFNSKEDLLNHYVENLFKDYLSNLRREKELTNDSVARIYFGFWKTHIDFLSAVIQNQLQSFLLGKFNEYLPQIYTVLQLELPLPQDSNQSRYALAFKIGGFWNILFEWANNGAKEEPIEMAQIVSKLVQNNLFGAVE